MKHFSYDAIPTVKKFQSDSSVLLAVRGEDKILIHLDWLLERYHFHDSAGDASLRRIILCDIFSTANYWIKSYHEHRPDMKKQRYPAVLALFEAVVNQLCTLFNCTRPMVAMQIEEIFGRDMTPEGGSTDRAYKAKYFDEKERSLYRIRFRGGLAYHYGLDASWESLKLKALDSAPFFMPIERKGGDGTKHPAFPGWGTFVMTLERGFFMSKHWLGEPGRKNVFHSAYTAGGMVSAAGSMEVKAGVITGIRPDSGHYKPTEQNFVSALQALQMFAVRMERVRLFDFKGDVLGTALEFMSSRLTWAQFQASGADLRYKRALAAELPPSLVPPDASTDSNASGPPRTYTKSPGGLR